MKFRMTWALLIVLAAAFVAAGCGSGDGADTTGTNGGDTEFNGDLKIGAILPLTGGLADFGKAGNAAAELAVSELASAADEAGLEGKPELVAEDGETEPDAGKSAAEKLTRSEDVSCIAGDWPSSSTIGIADSVTVDAGVPLISPSSTDPKITDLDDDGLVFRTAPSDLVQSQILADQIADDLGEGKTVSVAALNNDYGSSFAREFKQAAESNGLKVNEPVLYDPNGTQFDSEATKIVEGDPDAFVIVDYPDQGFPKLGPALVRTGKWSADRTWTTDGLRSTDLPKKFDKQLTEGMRGTAPTSFKSTAAATFDKLWKEENKGARQTYDSQNFDAVILCYLAAVAANSTSGEDIAAKLVEVSSPPGEKVSVENLGEALELLADGQDVDYDGASGPIDWDDNGDPTAALYEVWQYKGGALTTLSTVPFGDDEAEEGTETTGGAATTETP